jgi:ABC-2 type transport system permease protein
MTATTFERRLSGDSRPSGGPVTLFVLQTRSELLKTLRALDFTAAVVLLPVVLFALFGAPNPGATQPDGSILGPYVVASFGAYGMLGVVLFAFGEAIAAERGQGWLRLVRATPLSPAVYLGAKLVVAAFIGTLILLLLFPVAALVANVRLGIGQWLALGIALVLGALPLAPIGFLIGFWARPSSAGAISLLLLLPVSYLSGFWQPVPAMPEALQRIASVMPTYYFAELARSSIGIAGESPAVCIAWLAGTALVFGGLAVWGYRRDVGRQFA